MDFILNGFVRLKYWVLSFFYTNEEILDDWIARQVLNLSPRKECTRPRLLGTPKPKKTSFEMPPLVPKCLFSSESSTIRDGSSSEVVTEDICIRFHGGLAQNRIFFNAPLWGKTLHLCVHLLLAIPEQDSNGITHLEWLGSEES